MRRINTIGEVHPHQIVIAILRVLEEPSVSDVCESNVQFVGDKVREYCLLYEINIDITI